MSIFLKSENIMNLEIKNITKSYNDKTIIQNVNLNLQSGEIISLLGVSGVGKTTVFNILSGLTKPDSGQVILNNENITGKSGIVSYMLQKDLLFDFKTIIDNVSLPLIVNGKRKKDARKITKPYFEKFGLLGFENKYPKELSGGMRQKAALLRTYFFSGEIFLLDEPFSALDPITKYQMYEWYLDISKKMGISTIFITHDVDEAILLSNRIYILSGNPGKISKEINIKNKLENVVEFSLNNKFLEYKKEILDCIK